MILEVFSFTSNAQYSIQVIIQSAIYFVTHVTVPGTNVSFFKLMCMVLLFSVFIWAFRKMLGVESGYVIRDLHKPRSMEKSFPDKDGGN